MKGAHFHTGRVHAAATAPKVIELVAAGTVDPMKITGAEILDFDTADESILHAGVKPVFVR
jgi:hypothetical protein